MQRRYLFLLFILFSSIFGCDSSSTSYTGFRPVTQEEATVFAQQLVDKTSKGDTTWFQEVAEDIDAVAAVYSIAKLDIPSMFKNPTEQERIAWKSHNEKIFQLYKQNLKELRLKEIKQMGNTYIVVFNF